VDNPRCRDGVCRFGGSCYDLREGLYEAKDFLKSGLMRALDAVRVVVRVDVKGGGEVLWDLNGLVFREGAHWHCL
jgi:hypothetical protein